MRTYGLTSRELRALRALKTPARIQRWLDEVPYHHGRTAWSPRKVLAAKTAHCLEGALFAAAALRVNGYPPLLWDLEAERDDDHVLALFREHGHWGAIAKSNFSGLRYREPVYRTLRELGMSYFDDYFNLRGERTLRAFATRPVNMARFDKRHWMTTAEDLWYIAEYLVEVPHTKLISAKQRRKLNNVGARGLAAGKVGRR